MNPLVGLLCLLSCLSLPHQGLGTSRDYRSQCDNVISQWLDSLSVSETPENATLTVYWNGLGTALTDEGCPVKHLSLELWRVDPNSLAHRPQDFGTFEYFSAFERCNKLEPEHFLFHSTHTYTGLNETAVHFLHTVEKEYMFRICPCHRRRHRGMSCDCQYETDHNPRPQCSRIIQVEPIEHNEVMPWCLTGPAVLPHVGKRVEEVSLKSMLMNCTHLLVAGTMASCTPIQSYDQVLLTFHKLENTSSQACWEHRDFGTHNPVKVFSRLYSMNPFMDNFSHGMGEFTAIVNLTADSSYCVQLEHVRHPYCTREITISHSSTYRMPRVCSVHMAKPITTAVCTSPTTNVVTSWRHFNDSFFVATVLVVSVIIIIIGGCVIRKCCVANDRKSKDGRSAEHEPMISKIVTIDGVVSKDMGGHPEGNAKPEVFVLHFLRDDEETEGRSSMLRTWINASVEVVHDIEDESQDEEINPDPEGWVLERLCSPGVRVVLVASRSVTQLLRSEMSNASCSTESSRVESDESLESGEPGESEEDFDVNLDSRHCLRVFALKYIQSHLTGNYRQLVVVSFDKHCSDGDLVARLLTPNKGPLVLPHHLSYLQHWIHSGQVKGGGGGGSEDGSETESVSVSHRGDGGTLGPENC